MPDVLLIEDDPKITAALRVRLSAAGMDVRIADRGERGLELAREQTPQVAILDIRMPGIDGIETCRRLKADPQTEPCKVIFLSAETAESTRSEALAAGGESYITKPYNAASLITAIHEAAGQSSS